jgi:hypothetical protein
MKNAAAPRRHMAATTPMTIPAMAPPEMLEEAEAGCEFCWTPVTEAEVEEGLALSDLEDGGVVGVEDAEVEAGVLVASNMLSSTGQIVWLGCAEESEEYVSLTRSGVRLLMGFSCVPQQMLIWSCMTYH